MKRRYLFLAAAMLSLIVLSVAIFVGCSVAYRESTAKIQVGNQTGAVSSKIIPVAANPTPRRIVEAQPNEELWIIGRADKQQPPSDGQLIPGSGVLAAEVDSKLVPVPLKHTDVKASIAGYIATVDVTQQYQNPYSGKIEAVYAFPLPDNAAVSEFVMTIGQRRIRGIIRERQEAERIYKEARGQGYVATLLTQERPNIFTQRVANIEPGKQIDVNLRYFHTLNYNDGAYEFVFPMVVGPRFNPAGSAQGIGAVSRDGRGSSGQSTEIQYLRTNERSGHDISLSVAIDAGLPVDKVECNSHAIERTPSGEGKMQVKLAASDTIPNKDFVLRYEVAGHAPKSTFIASHDNRGGFFTLMILPPKELSDAPRQPLEMVFTLDTSGSMDGRPLEQSKLAMNYALTHMNSADSFQIINFSDHPTKFAQSPIAASPHNRAKIADLTERAAWEENRELPQQVKNLAMEFGLVSPYTAFLAVDASQRTAGNVGTTVDVPVPVPEGVKYETTVGEGQPKKVVEMPQ